MEEQEREVENQCENERALAKEKAAFDRERLMNVVTKAGFVAAGAAALITSVKTVADATSFLEVAPMTIRIPFADASFDFPLGANERQRQMKVDLAQIKKQIAAARIAEQKQGGVCPCLTPSEKAQIFITDAERFLDDAHQSIRTGNFQAVTTAWSNVRRDLDLAREALGCGH